MKNRILFILFFLPALLYAQSWGNEYRPYGYDDLQTSISNIKTPAANAPTWRDYNMGIGSGVTFPVLGFAVNDYIYFDLQTSHSMQLNSGLDLHFHYVLPSDGTGDRFQFQLDVVSAGVTGTWSVVTGSPFTAEKTMAANLSTIHSLLEVAEIPGVNTTVSTVYKCKLTRIAASQDEFAGEIYITYIDAHYFKDGIGSPEEYTK